MWTIAEMGKCLKAGSPFCSGPYKSGGAFIVPLLHLEVRTIEKLWRKDDQKAEVKAYLLEFCIIFRLLSNTFDLNSLD